MIVCSRCQFENPVHNRYCQECGDLLGQDVASEHQSDPPLAPMPPDETAQRAGNDLEKERSPQDTMVHLHNDEDTSEALLAILTHVPAGLKQASADGQLSQYLDRTHRYQLTAPLIDPPVNPVKEGFEVLVMDSHPDSPPYLEQDKHPTHPDTTAPSENAEAIADVPNIAIPLVGSGLPAKIEGKSATPPKRSALPTMALRAEEDSTPTIDVPLIGEDTVASTPIPMVWTLADGTASNTTKAIQTIQTYFDLQEQLYPSFPRLVDAWDDGGAVVLLENRSELVCLKDIVVQPNVVPPQLLHWCHEMTELWEVLSNHQCSQSLLKLDNVRIDEDQILCLRRLYFDDAPGQYTLKDLGQLWAILFDQHANGPKVRHCPSALVSIYQDLISTAIADLDTLRLRLEAAADHIHQSALGSDSLTAEKDALKDTDGVTHPPLAEGEEGQPGIPLTAPDAPLDQTLPSEGLETPAWALEEAQYQEASSGTTGLGDDPTIVLPMQLHTLSNAGLTNIGIQRDHNEDFFSMDTQLHTTDLPSGRVCKAKGLYILCDGMGGHAAGEVASEAAGATLHNYFQDHWTDTLPDEATIHKAIVAANQGIYEQNQADASEGSRRMGTTLVMLLVQDTKAAIAHVGDSRIYRFTRRQGLEQLTVDHEVGQREIARGVAPDVAYARPDAYQLTQALGPRDQDFIRPDVQFIDMNEDSLFILGSDGLTDNDLLETYCDSHIEPLISTNANLDEGTYNLIELANQVNGHDNITVLLVRVKLRPKLSMLNR